MEMMRAVTLKSFGGPQMLQLSRIPKVSVTRPTDVLIKVVAAGVNRADAAQRRGHNNAPKGASEVLGLECSGIVADVGAEVKNVKPGDSVMALLTGGGYAEYCVSHHGTVMPVPHGYSYSEAAAVPESFLTAWFCLHARAKLGKRKNVLLHAGTSTISMAAAQLVERYYEGTAITTCAAEKVDVCKNYASINLDRTPDETGARFAPKIINLLGDSPIDLILDPLFGGSYLTENSVVLARDGKIVVLACLAGARVQLDALPLLRQGAELIFARLRDRDPDSRTELVKSFCQEIGPLLDERVVAPPPTRAVPLEEVMNAHLRLDDKETTGKMVLIVDPELSKPSKPNRPIQ